jgi:hypothetical protein
MNYKRRHCRRQVRCTLCTADRWKGNAKDRRPEKEKGLRKAIRQEISDA